MHAGPAAGGVGRGRHQRDAKFDAGERQAQPARRAAVEPGKRRDAGGTDAQQRHVLCRRIGQGHRGVTFFDRKTAGNLEEAKGVDVEVALDPQQLAECTIGA